MPMVGAAKTLRCVVQSLLIGAALLYVPKPAFAQAQQEQPPQDHTEAAPAGSARPAALKKDDPQAKQHKRILGIIPNYRSVSANTQLPPLAVKDKFWLATQDSFDYSSFIVAGVIAGTGQAKNS